MTVKSSGDRTGRPSRAERTLELALFQARWLMAPFYVGLAIALAGLLVIFVNEARRELVDVFTMLPADGVVMVLSLIDLSLTANLLLIVIFSGYESFVSKIDAGNQEDRPAWMGTIDFSGLKMKLMASITAISAVALLRALLQMAHGEDVAKGLVTWLLAVHVTFVISSLLLAATDWLASKSHKT